LSVKECPLIWEGITVISHRKELPFSVFKELEKFLKSKYFEEWYRMRYSTTRTHGDFIFFKSFVERYPCSEEVKQAIKDVYQIIKETPSPSNEA